MKQYPTVQGVNKVKVEKSEDLLNRLQRGTLSNISVFAFDDFTVSFTFTARCALGYTGSEKKATVTYQSGSSYYEATQQAYLKARKLAYSQLVCTPEPDHWINGWYYGKADYTATCPKSCLGQPVTAEGVYLSGISQLDADTQALELAMANANALIRCLDEKENPCTNPAIDQPNQPDIHNGGAKPNYTYSMQIDKGVVQAGEDITIKVSRLSDNKSYDGNGFAFIEVTGQTPTGAIEIVTPAGTATGLKTVILPFATGEKEASITLHTNTDSWENYPQVVIAKLTKDSGEAGITMAEGDTIDKKKTSEEITISSEVPVPINPEVTLDRTSVTRPNTGQPNAVVRVTLTTAASPDDTVYINLTGEGAGAVSPIYINGTNQALPYLQPLPNIVGSYFDLGIPSNFAPDGSGTVVVSVQPELPSFGEIKTFNVVTPEPIPEPPVGFLWKLNGAITTPAGGLLPWPMTLAQAGVPARCKFTMSYYPLGDPTAAAYFAANADSKLAEIIAEFPALTWIPVVSGVTPSTAFAVGSCGATSQVVHTIAADGEAALLLGFNKALDICNYIHAHGVSPYPPHDTYYFALSVANQVVT